MSVPPEITGEAEKILAAMAQDSEATVHPKASPEERAEQLAAVDVLAEAMKHELLCNAHKGDWRADGLTPEGASWEIVYHAAKLVLALRAGDRPAILEFAADVANGALMVADTAGVLELELLSDEPTVSYGHRGLKVYAAEWIAALGPEGRVPATEVPF